MTKKKGSPKMKKTLKKILVVLLAVLMLLPCVACGKSVGGTAISLGNVSISGGMIGFWLSRYKATFLYYYGNSLKAAYGLSNVEDIWAIKEETTGKTYDEVFTAYVLDNARTYLCALYLFDQFDLKLSDTTVKKVDDLMEELIDNYGGGSKSEFNAELAPYGINYKTLRELYLIDEKVDALKEYLYGVKGTEKITSADMENYYKENYVRMRQVCVFINSCPEVNDDGSYKTDKDGYTLYRDMTADETQAARARAEEALAKLTAGVDYDSVRKAYDENTADDAYINGIYMCADSAYGESADLQKLFEALQGMKTGEIKMIELSNSLNIIEKLELDAAAYNQKINEDFFLFWDSSSQGLQSFAEYLKTPMFLKYIADHLESYSADIKTYDDVLGQYKISGVKANYEF